MTGMGNGLPCSSRLSWCCPCRTKRSDSPDKAAERIRASTKPEEQKRRAAAAARAALPAGRPNGTAITADGHNHAAANGNGAADGVGPQRSRQRDGDRGSSQQQTRGAGDDARDGSTGGQKAGSRGRNRSKAEPLEAAVRSGKQPARSRGEASAAAVVTAPGSRVPDVVVDRPQRAADRCAAGNLRKH